MTTKKQRRQQVAERTADRKEHERLQCLHLQRIDRERRDVERVVGIGETLNNSEMLTWMVKDTGLTRETVKDLLKNGWLYNHLTSYAIFRKRVGN